MGSPATLLRHACLLACWLDHGFSIRGAGVGVAAVFARCCKNIYAVALAHSKTRMQQFLEILAAEGAQHHLPQRLPMVSLGAANVQQNSSQADNTRPGNINVQPMGKRRNNSLLTSDVDHLCFRLFGIPSNASYLRSSATICCTKCTLSASLSFQIYYSLRASAR